MLNDFQADRVYIACGYTDLRRGIDGLASLVESQFRLDPFSRALFLFCGRRSDRIKALYWEGDGFVLLYKRLENGSFQWPRNTSLFQPQKSTPVCDKSDVLPYAQNRLSIIENGSRFAHPFVQTRSRFFVFTIEMTGVCIR